MTNHTATITHDPESHAYGEGCHDECTAQVTCSGVTDACRCWWECDTCREAMSGLDQDALADFEERLEDEGSAHGKEHQRIDGMWMTPSTQCLTQAMETDAYDLVFRLPDGQHPVDIDCDEGYVYIIPITIEESIA